MQKTTGLLVQICLDHLLDKYLTNFELTRGHPVLDLYKSKNSELGNKLYQNAGTFMEMIYDELLPHLEQKFNLKEIGFGCNYYPNSGRFENYAFEVGVVENRCNDPQILFNLLDPINQEIDLWLTNKNFDQLTLLDDFKLDSA